MNNTKFVPIFIFFLFIWMSLLIANTSGADETRKQVEPIYPGWENNTGIEIQNIYGSDGSVEGQLNTYTAPETGYRIQEIIIDPYNTEE